MGDIRGGISVEFPVEFNTNWTLILSHIFIALGGSGLILIFGTKLNNVMRFLNDQSKLDGLTQIHNYRYFQEFYDREFLFSRRHHIPLSIAICDINNFKFYNDSYGHLAGDDCLKRVAQILKSVLKRPGDLVVRYGGDEFVFVLPNTKAAGALDIADLLRSEVEALQIPHKESEASDYVTISIGVTTSLCFDITRDELFEIADQALYQAKENSDKFVIFLEPQLNQSDDQQ